MKNLLIIFSLLLTSVSWSKDVNYMDLVIRNGLHYEKFTNELFTGKVVGFEKGYIKAGKIEGEWREYWRNGQLFKECFFINGLLEGESITYWENGVLMHKHNYERGKENGEFLSYHQNGKLWIRHYFKDGKLEGETLLVS